MSYALVASTSAASSNGSSVSTAAINTTGATLLIMVLSWYSGGGATPTVTDSAGNTPQLLATAAAGSGYCISIYFLNSPTTSATHAVTIGSASANVFPSVALLAYSGPSTSAVEVMVANAAGSGTTLKAGGLTPSQNGELLISACDPSSGTSITIDSGFTALTANFVTGHDVALGAAYLIQTTAAAVNPQWSWTTSGACAAILAAFKPASGSGSGGVSLARVMGGL